MKKNWLKKPICGWTKFTGLSEDSEGICAYDDPAISRCEDCIVHGGKQIPQGMRYLTLGRYCWRFALPWILAQVLFLGLLGYWMGTFDNHRIRLPEIVVTITAAVLCSQSFMEAVPKYFSREKSRAIVASVLGRKSKEKPTEAKK